MTCSPSRRGRTLALSLAVVAVASGGCRAATLAYGTDLASARVHADALAAAIEHRFTQVTRTPKFANARLRLGRYAMAPSKLVNDTALWTSMRSTRIGADRDLEIHAGLRGGMFAFTARQAVPLPVQLGDQRHLMSLKQLGEDEWLWRTDVDQAVGTLPPARVNDITRALLQSAERPAAVMRADYRSAFPRTTEAIGRLLTLDSVGTTAQGDGSTLVTMQITVSGDRLRGTFPAYAKYIAKYVEPARYRFRLSDRRGGDFFDAHALNRVLTMRFRSRNGELQPLLGAARRMPDTLSLHVDALAKISFFTVGVTAMQGQFVHVNTARERGWAMRFTSDPKWHLPFIAERLLRTPLRRPFEGEGVLLRMSFQREEDGPTLLRRTAHMAVRESAIMRFLGNLGFTALSDFAGAVEDEENRFLAEAFSAMRKDIAAIR